LEAAAISLYVGCCGYPVSRTRYYTLFKTVELQQTFYNLPTLDTASRWRREAPSDFVFNMKAWQVITHPSSSPTWRRLRSLPPGQIENYGFLKPTRENLDAWKKSLEIAKVLRARVIVLQTPPSFKYSEEHVKWVNEFFSHAGREAKSSEIIIGWEPRGDWKNFPDVLKNVICTHEVIHITDPLRLDPIVCEGQKVLYFRLHGLGGREVNYRYKYTDEDLEKLTSKINKYINAYEDIREIYVMFNNIYMLDDSKRFRDLAAKHFNNILGIKIL